MTVLARLTAKVLLTNVFYYIGKFYFLFLGCFHALVSPVTKKQEPFSMRWEWGGDSPEVSGDSRAGTLLRVGADLRRGCVQMAFDFLMSQYLEWVG